MRQTPHWVNSKIPLAIIGSNTHTPLRHIAHHASGSLSWRTAAAMITWCIILGPAVDELRMVSAEFVGVDAI